MSSNSGLLTYRVTEPVKVGQLVLIPLRGRIIPGIVTKCNVQAGTITRISPVKQVTPIVLPLVYLEWVKLVSNYYCVSPATVFYSTAEKITKNYWRSVGVQAATQNSKKSSTKKTRLFITPTSETPATQVLAKTFTTINEASAPVWQNLWRQATSGNPLCLIGSSKLFGLPFAKIDQIILDQPFAQPYYSDRSPGYSTAVLACLLAQAHQADLVIRTAIPLGVLKGLLPLPKKCITQPPTLKPVELLIQGVGGALNSNLVAAIQQKRRLNQKVLVIDNRSTKTGEDGTLYGLSVTANKLGKLLNEPVALVSKTENSASLATNQSTNSLTVATTAALYRNLKPDYTVVLNAEQYLSVNTPTSIYRAIDALATLAARSPILIQTKNEVPLLTSIIKNGLQLTQLEQQQLPAFNRRIIIIKPTVLTAEHRQKLQQELTPLFGPPTVIEQALKTGFWFTAARQLTVKQQQFLKRESGSVKIMTDAPSFPLVSS